MAARKTAEKRMVVEKEVVEGGGRKGGEKGEKGEKGERRRKKESSSEPLSCFLFLNQNSKVWNQKYLDERERLSEREKLLYAFSISLFFFFQDLAVVPFEERNSSEEAGALALPLSLSFSLPDSQEKAKRYTRTSRRRSEKGFKKHFSLSRVFDFSFLFFSSRPRRRRSRKRGTALALGEGKGSCTPFLSLSPLPDSKKMQITTRSREAQERRA